jgi:magnesium chelatase family protein
MPKPGEISLSHHGILFLDELTEFPRRHLDTLRQPLESGNISISRSQQTLSYPASFIFIGACNPCPCGYRNDTVKQCVCTDTQAERYWSRLSGPLLDRIDLYVQIYRPTETELAKTLVSESSESIRQRVLRAVEIQRQRTQRTPGSQIQYNSQLRGRQFNRFCQIDDATRKKLATNITAAGMSARAFDRILRVARTLADLDGQTNITDINIGEALTYRTNFKPDAQILIH